jgi:hypothetical protein
MICCLNKHKKMSCRSTFAVMGGVSFNKEMSAVNLPNKTKCLRGCTSRFVTWKWVRLQCSKWGAPEGGRGYPVFQRNILLLPSVFHMSVLCYGTEDCCYNIHH